MALSFTTYMSRAMQEKQQQLHKMSYNWRVVLPSLALVGTGNTDTSSPISDLKSWTGDGVLSALTTKSDLSLRVYEATIPMPSFENTIIYSPDYDWGRATHKQIGDLVLVIDEMEDGETFNYLNNWMNMIKNDNGTYNLPYSYRGVITQIDVAGSGIDLNTTTMEGCYPISIEPRTINYDDVSVVQYRVTFNCDKVSTEFLSATEIESRIAARQVALSVNIGGWSSAGLENMIDGVDDVFNIFGL